MSRPPCPLQWPDGWARTPEHRREASPFKTGLTTSIGSILRRLERMGARHIVITSNLPTRRDGKPYATTSEPADPGIAVWWVDRQGGERVMGCDRWRRVRDNMHAVNLSLQALHGLERWGASEIVRRAFAGFAALPAGSADEPMTQSSLRGHPHPSRSWRDVLGGNWPIGLHPADELAVAKARHRDRIRDVHPDRGGHAPAAAEINAAFDAAVRELSRETTH